MAAPWEKYAKTESGPWSKYAAHEPVAAPEAPTLGGETLQLTKDLAGGLVRGAGSIGATILALTTWQKTQAGKGLSLQSNRERRWQWIRLAVARG